MTSIFDTLDLEHKYLVQWTETPTWQKSQIFDSLTDARQFAMEHIPRNPEQVVYQISLLIGMGLPIHLESILKP